MQEINVNYAAYTHVNVKPLQQESHKTLYFTMQKPPFNIFLQNLIFFNISPEHSHIYWVSFQWNKGFFLILWKVKLCRLRQKSHVSVNIMLH